MGSVASPCNDLECPCWLLLVATVFLQVPVNSLELY